MISFLLKNPNFYRLYQKTVRSKYDEFDFIKFIFIKKNFKNIRMLDICCGDSFILKYIGEYIDDYLGVDNNEEYLKKCKEHWKKFNFINLDLNQKKNVDHLIKFKPNFIFINGAIHHFDDTTVKSINSFIASNFSDSYFLSVDPVKDNSYCLINQFIKNFKNSKTNNKINFQVIKSKKNLGKGSALKLGVKKAKYDWILTTDVDMSVSLFQICNWIKKKYINKKSFVYFGSRKHEKSIVEANFIRQILGGVMNLLTNIILNIKIKDTQCGYKLSWL